MNNNNDSSPHTPAAGPSRWMVVAGMALIALQLLTLQAVLQRHARAAQAQAANYVTVTLQPPVQQAAAAGAQPLLLAGN